MTCFECSICFENLETPLAYSTDSTSSLYQIQIKCTPCGHLFHKICLDAWLKINKRARTCPSCRTKIRLCEIRDVSVEDSAMMISHNDNADDIANVMVEGQEGSPDQLDLLRTLLAQYRELISSVKEDGEKIRSCLRLDTATLDSDSDADQDSDEDLNSSNTE